MMTTEPMTATPTVLRSAPSDGVYYPDSDGKPMAESGLHRDIMLDVIFMLRQWFARQSDDVYVSGNILVYYVEGDPRRSVAPDALVIKGVRQYRRRVVKLWEEGRAPQVVFEVTSSSTRREDTGRKRHLYAELGVREYYMYDPTGDYLAPRLQAWVLAEDRANGPAYREMPLLTEEPGYLSPELGLEVRLRRDGRLGLRDPASGEWLETIAEMRAARDGVEAALDQEKSARYQAEVALIKAETRQEQIETALHEEQTARQQAEVARREAEAAADAESQARARLDQEVVRLRARLADLGEGSG